MLQLILFVKEIDWSAINNIYVSNLLLVFFRFETTRDLKLCETYLAQIMYTRNSYKQYFDK